MIETILALLFGLLIGSFLNVCVYRLPRDLSVVRPRSFCPFCEAPIAWYDNIPLVSYLRLGGKCRACHASIPIRYPLVELATGLGFAGAVWVLGPTPAAGRLCVFLAILVTLIATDFEERILPDEFTLGGTVVGLLFAWFIPMNTTMSSLLVPSVTDQRVLSVVEALVGAAISAGSIYAVAKFYEIFRHKEGMGLGDVKMVAMIGTFLGLQGTLLTLIFASVAGGVGGLLYIWITRKDAATYQIPFGAFLGAAAAAVAFLGAAAIHRQ